MRNNEILRRVGRIFNFDEGEIIDVFGSTDQPVSSAQISDMLRDEHDPYFQECDDSLLAVFLNGLINYKRGRKEGAQPEPEKYLTNNMILMKLRIALNLKAEDVIEIMARADFKITKYELSAFSRKPNHNN